MIVNDKDRQIVTQTAKELARCLGMDNVEFCFELYDGRANVLRVNGELGIFYFDDRSPQPPPVTAGNWPRVRRMVHKVRRRWEPIALKLAGLFGKLRTVVNGDDVYAESISPFGPRGRRRKRKSG